MSAPDTNIEKQEKRHRPSLFGTKGALVIGGLILVAVVLYSSISGSDDAALGTSGSEVTAAPTDTYAPGTNNSATPTATD